MPEAERVEMWSAVIAAGALAVGAATLAIGVWNTNQENDRRAKETKEEYVRRVSLQEAPNTPVRNKRFA